MSLLELTSAYAAVASGRYPVAARGLPVQQPEEGLSAFFQRAGMLHERRDRAQMLDLLFAATNSGTGRRAALRVPTFGKTGTTRKAGTPCSSVSPATWSSACGSARRQQVAGQDQRRHRPGQIWRNFMVSALAVDGQRGPELPAEFRAPRWDERPAEERELESPIPPEVERPDQGCASWASGCARCSRSSRPAQFLNARGPAL